MTPWSWVTGSGEAWAIGRLVGVSDWEEACTLFRQHFRVVRIQLNSIKQSAGESVCSYADKLVLMVEYLDMDVDDSAVIQLFKIGRDQKLAPFFYMAAASRSDLTIGEARELALQAEFAINGANVKQSPVTPNQNEKAGKVLGIDPAAPKDEGL